MGRTPLNDVHVSFLYDDVLTLNKSLIADEYLVYNAVDILFRHLVYLYLYGVVLIVLLINRDILGKIEVEQRLYRRLRRRCLILLGRGIFVFLLAGSKR